MQALFISDHFPQAKFYRKLWERMESEKGILAYLQAQVWFCRLRLCIYWRRRRTTSPKLSITIACF